jgi:hypothetical protein
MNITSGIMDSFYSLKKKKEQTPYLEGNPEHDVCQGNMPKEEHPL